MSKTIAFFGSGPVAASSLDFLSDHFSIEYVITKSVPAHHKGIAPVEELANSKKLPLLFADNKTDLTNLIDNKVIKSDIGILVDYGVIVPKNVIDSFKLGIVNSHFSLLPEWRGADPITFSILSGQPKTGVSLMLIEPAMDTGKLITQKSLTIDLNDTSNSLTNRLIDLSNKLSLEYIPQYVAGSIKPKNQPHPGRATYSQKLAKADGIIDWQKPADQIEREVRAFLGWPGSQATIGGHRIIVKNTHILDTAEDPLDIKCGDGKFLSIDELVAPSGRIMTAGTFLNGYKI